MKRISITTIALCSVFFVSFAQVITPFTVKKTVTQKGGIVFLANTSSKATPDNIIQNELPPAGKGYDNLYVNGYVDIDADPTTWMSSSDQLNLPTCSEISWAGMYWGADCSLGDENFETRNQVKLKVNGGAYLDLTADYLKDNTAGYKSYHCFKDITSIMQANGLTDRYTVGNVSTDVGAKNLFGGWTIVVVYKNNTQSMRNLTVFDGLANVSAGRSTVDIPISGFQTPLLGPVNFELGMVTYDGDRSLVGDQLQFKGVSSFINISDAIHTSSDFFNSTISRNGVLTPLRIPSYNNTLGYDANIYAPINTSKNYIGNNAISAIIRQTTGGETYLTQVVTSAIDVYEPDLRSSVRVKNITNPSINVASAGDVLEYTVTGLNIGSDPSVNTFLTDTIEGNAQYVPNSISITSGQNAGVMTDLGGDDQAEYIASKKVVKVRIGSGANSLSGGSLNNSPTGADSTQIKFRVQVSSDCVILACDNVIDNRSVITGTGNVSENTYSISSNPVIFDPTGCPITGTTKTTIVTSGCAAATASVNTPICPGNPIHFTATYSPNATYRWSGPNGFSSLLREPSIVNATALHGGTYTATISIPGKTCEYVFPIEVIINAANAGPDQIGSTTCGVTNVKLEANQPTGTTGVWSIVTGVGGSFVNTADPTTLFNGVTGSNYTLRWTLNSPGCSTTTDDVNIKFNIPPSTSVISGKSTICYNNYANVKVVITGGTAPYTVELTNGGGIFTNYTSGNDIIVGPLQTSKTLKIASVTDANGCLSLALKDSAIITVGDAISGTALITRGSTATGSEGPRNAGGNGLSGTKYPWASITSAYVSDDVYATETLTGTNTAQYVYYRTFGFTSANIPSLATITGIEVLIEKNYTTTGNITVRDKTVQLTRGGSTVGINKALTTTDWPLNTDAVITYPATGGSTDLWGTTWSAANIIASNFGVKINVQRFTPTGGTGIPTARIDNVRIKVYYTQAYCDDASGVTFTVSGCANATAYAWTPPAGGSITAGQGTATATVDLNGAGQSGTYTIAVTPSNTCETSAPVSLSFPITNCVNSSIHIKGNVYWDKNGMTDNLVNGVGVGSINGSPLYMTLITSTGNTAAQNSIAVSSYGLYDFTVPANIAYNVGLSKNSYTAGQTFVTGLPTGASYTGEIANSIYNTHPGTDSATDGILSLNALTTSNRVNVNFGIKIATPPVTVNDITTTNEDVQVSLNVTANDSDPDGSVNAATVDLNTDLTGIQTTNSNSYGNWSVNESGVVTYTPAIDYNGNAYLTYAVNDNEENTSSQGTIMVKVNPVNNAPQAIADAITTLEDNPVNFNITTNDTDIDGKVDASTVDLDPNTAGIQTTYSVANEGNYAVNSLGVLTFTPVLNFNGRTTTINYTIKDDMGAVSATATVSVVVTSVIDSPIALNDEATTTQNTPVSINVILNDTGVDGAINVSSVDLDPFTTGIQTEYIVYGEATYTTNNEGIITCTSLPVFYGKTTPLNYTVYDKVGNPSNIAILSISVIANSAPVAANDATTTTQGVPVTINVTTNDAAPNGSLNVSRIDLDPITTGIQQSYDVLNIGTFMVDMAGEVTFQPIYSFYGTATVDYTVKDNLGLISNIAKVTVLVNQANQAPVTTDDAVSTNEDTAITFNVITNDTDPDGTIAANSVDLDIVTVGQQTTYTMNDEGTYTVDNLGNVTFIPVLNFNGKATPVGYFILDNQGLTSDITVPGLITVTVVSVNDAPMAFSNIESGPSNTNISFNVVGNDFDLDGTIDTTSVDLNPNYSGIQKTFSVPNEGTYSVDDKGLVTFTPEIGFIGPITTTIIYYTVSDNQGLASNSATINITLASPDSPKASNDIATMNEDGGSILISPLLNDLAGAGVIDPTMLDLDLGTTGIQNSISNTYGSWTANANAEVTFIPTPNFNGEATLNYTVVDDLLNTSNPTSITITVNPVNDAPTFIQGSNQSVTNDANVQIINNWATAISAGPANEKTQTASFETVSVSNSNLFSDQPTIDASGTLYYTPAENVSGESIVTVKIIDDGGTNNGGISFTTQTFTITVKAIAPTVSTSAISAVTNIKAVSGGSITLSGGQNITARGICWSTSPDPTIALSTKTSNGTGTGEFTGSMLNLTPKTTYYVRAYATNAAGFTSYGNEMSFTTFATLDVQTSNIIAEPSFSSANISWTNGNKSTRIVFVKEGIGEISYPENLKTYTASTNWENKGTQLGSSGYYCIYKGTGSNVYLTNLYPGNLYSIQAFEYSGNSGSENYITAEIGANNPSSVTTWATTTFSNRSGVSSAEAWNSTSRWDHNIVPSENLHEAVKVYIDGNCEVADSTRCYNLTILAPHGVITPRLTINAGKSLEVSGGTLAGSLVNNGNASALVVKASPSLANGSLVYTNGEPMGTVEMYSKAYIDNKQHWQYFGIPVSSLKINASFGANSKVRKFDESNRSAGGLNVGLWDELAADATLTPTTGYEVVQPAATTYSFAGVLNHGNFNINLPYTQGANWKGQSVITNPYPSAIDIKSLTFSSKMEASVYQFNTGSYAEWQLNALNNTPGNQPGAYIVSTRQTAGILDIPKVIPSMQGFLVIALAPNATFGIPYSAARNENRTMQKAPATEIAATQIDLIGSNASDRMWIITSPSCTNKFDNGWDGRKIIATTNTPQIFAFEPDGEYQIDAVNDINETYLGFQGGQDKDYKLVFKHQNLSVTYPSLYLVDLLENKTTDISASGTEVTFSAESNAGLSKRFKIITNTQKTEEERNNAAKIRVFSTPDEIFVENNGEQTGVIEFYNLAGGLFKTIPFTANDITRVSTDQLIAGAYLVNVRTETEKVALRIIIR